MLTDPHWSLRQRQGFRKIDSRESRCFGMKLAHPASPETRGWTLPCPCGGESWALGLCRLCDRRHVPNSLQQLEAQRCAHRLGSVTVPAAVMIGDPSRGRPGGLRSPSPASVPSAQRPGCTPRPRAERSSQRRPEQLPRVKSALWCSPLALAPVGNHVGS